MVRDWLIEYRGERTQEEVAKLIGLRRASYASYESGRRTPNPKKAKIIGNFLGFNWTRFYD